MARIIINGTIVRSPQGGLGLYHLGFLAGLKKLGHEAYFVEKSSWENDCYNPVTKISSNDCQYGISFLLSLLERYNLKEQWCYVDIEGTYYGLQKKDIEDKFATADLYIDLEWGEWLEESTNTPAKVFLDGEPGWFQFKMKKMLMSGKPLPLYDYYFTTGNLIGTKQCKVPTLGIDWKHCLCPTLLEEVKETKVNKGAPFTTIMKWQSNKPVEFEGEVYGQKDVEFERIINIPQLVSEEMEVAVSGSDVPRKQLSENGWQVKDADNVCLTVDSYLNYLSASKGEFTIAKNSFVKTRCGWFGDRAGYYLGSGRPVILQETGFSEFLPCGNGLFSFQNLGEAVDAINEVSNNFNHHSKAAYEIASEYLEAEKVMKKFLNEVGL